MSIAPSHSHTADTCSCAQSSSHVPACVQSANKQAHVRSTDMQASEVQTPFLQPVHRAYIDWLRICATLAVVCIHVLVSAERQPYLSASAQAFLHVQTLISIWLFRWAVPVFFMISGALLLDPARHITPRKMGHHIVRIAVCLAVVGTVFSCIELWVTKHLSGFELIYQAILCVLQAKTWDHLWFLYKLIGLYAIVLPLRIVLEHSSIAQLRASLCIGVVSMFVIPFVNNLCHTTFEQYLPISYELVYFVLGYYLSRARINLPLCIAGFSVSALCMMYLEQTQIIPASFMPESVWMCIMSCSLFGMVRVLDERRHTAAGTSNSIRTADSAAPSSSCCLRGILHVFLRDSFGIYLFHVLFLHICMYTAGSIVMAYGSAHPLASASAYTAGAGFLGSCNAAWLTIVTMLHGFGLPELVVYGAFELACIVICLCGSIALTRLLRLAPICRKLL